MRRADRTPRAEAVVRLVSEPFEDDDHFLSLSLPENPWLAAPAPAA